MENISLKELTIRETRSIPPFPPTTNQPALNKSSTRPASSSFRALRTETALLEKTIHSAIKPESIERRAAIDVGSGSTKVAIADFDLITGKIVRVLYEGSFPVPYQSHLEISPDRTFDAEIQSKALTTFGNIQDLLQQHGVTKVVAVATEAYRKASNGVEFATEVARKTGIPLQVISQQEEGKIAFYSAVASSHKNPEDLIIWDIGTGSFQIIADQEIDDELAVYMQSMGSVPFKNYIIRDVQGKDPSVVKSPNPMSQEDWIAADALARSMGRHALSLIKEKIKTADGHVVGIGRLFSSSVKPIGADGKITRDDLRAFIRASLGHTDEELGDPFANVNVSNAILVLGVMKALHMHEIDIVGTTSTEGILSCSAYWENPAGVTG